MHGHARRIAMLFSPLILVTACGSGQQHTRQLLDDRMQTQLAPDIAAGRAAFQPLPDGVQVTLLDPSLFPNDKKAMAGNSPDIRAGVIEALLDPSLMRVQVTDTSALPDAQRDTRVRNVRDYFVNNGLGPTLLPAEPSQVQVPAAAAPAGLTITINLECPARHGGWGYGSGKSMPVCD